MTDLDKIKIVLACLWIFIAAITYKDSNRQWFFTAIILSSVFIAGL